MLFGEGWTKRIEEYPTEGAVIKEKRGLQEVISSVDRTLQAALAFPGQ